MVRRPTEVISEHSSNLDGPQGRESTEDTTTQFFQLVEAQVEVEQGVQLTECRRVLEHEVG